QGGGAPLSGLVDAVGITPAIRFFLPSFFFAKKKRKELEKRVGGDYFIVIRTILKNTFLS
ncbi:MAG: hypothetical protein IKC65_09465, partial [Lentisphaeria bacterium]|nr:hypothetical protein [Lentisphaeria bacterium]